MSSFNMPGGSGSGDKESSASMQSLLAQLRRQSGPDSPGQGSNSAGHGPELLSHFNSSYYSVSNNDSPNFPSATDSPAFPPAAPTPPAQSFPTSHYLSGPMNPIGTGRDAPDGRTANLLSLLKNSSGQGGSSQQAHEPAVTLPHVPMPPSVIHAPAPAAADPSGLLAALMRGSLQNEPAKEQPAAPSAWNPTSPSTDTQQYLLNLLNRPKPSQSDVPGDSQPAALPEPPAPEHGENLGAMTPSGPTELPAMSMPSSEFDFHPKSVENMAPKYGESPRSQHSQAGSTAKPPSFNYSNPFEDFGSSPVHRTPKSSTTPGASGSATVSSQTAPMQILKKPDSAQSNHDNKRALSERSAIGSPEHTRRKVEHVSSPLSQLSANRTPQYDDKAALATEKERATVSEAMSEIAETADRQAQEALARAEEEQAQLEIARNLDGMANAKTEQEFEDSAQGAAQAIQHELDKEENRDVLESTLSPEVAKAVHEIVDEAAASQGPVADSWESAEADEIIVIEETNTPVKVYNFPMKPWITLALQETDEPRAAFRSEVILDIARLKKDFDQNDRNLVSPSEAYITYGMSKAGGLRVIRQEDGKDAKLFTDTKDRIFNLSISSIASASGQHPKEAIIGTGVSGTVYWVQLRDGDRDHLDDAHPEQYGFALPPLTTHEGDAPGGVLKTRARPSSMHPDYFAVGRGKSINIIWPSFVLEKNLFKTGHDRVVDTENLLKQCSLKINTGKAGKDFTFSQDDTLVASLDKSGRVKFWDVRELTAVREGSSPSHPMPAHTSLEIKDPLMTLTTTPDGEKAWPTSVLLLDKFRPYQKRAALRYMIVGMKQNHTLQLWDLALGKPVQEFHFPHNKESDAVCSVMYHAPSSMLVVGHPTRNSIYFLHLSAPKYSLKNLSQVDYIQRLVAQDPAIPQPESTAVISGLREYSFANKGVLRSLSILENPSMSADGDEPTLFELYAVHSKGVTCLSIKQAELGWSKDNKVIVGVDAVELGLVKITKLAPLPSTQTSAEATVPAEGNGVPQIRIASRSAKDVMQKTPSSQGEPDKKGESAKEKEDAETPVHAPEKTEKNRRKKKSSANSAPLPAADRELGLAPNGAADLSRTSSQNKASATKASSRPEPAQPSSHVELSQETLESLVSNMESRIIANVSERFDSVLKGIVGQITELQNRRDKDFMESQAGLLNMVAEVLNKNTESVLKDIVVRQFEATVPDLARAIERSVADHFSSKFNAHVAQAIQKEMQKALPGAVGQAIQKPDAVKALSDKVCHNVNAHLDAQIGKSVSNLLPAFGNKTAQAMQQVAEDIGQRVDESNGRVEQHRRDQDAKMDKLMAQTSKLTSLVSGMAASQAQLQKELATLKQQLQVQERDRDRDREREREREHEPIPQASHARGQGQARGSGSSHNTSHNAGDASRELVNYQGRHHEHAPEPQVLYAPTNREKRDKMELDQLVNTIDGLMAAQNFDEAMMHWLQSTDKTEEVYNRVIAKYNPAFVASLQPLLLLSVGATVSQNLDSPQVAQKMSMLEMVIYYFNGQVPNLDEQLREVTPKIMSLLKTRIEHLVLQISRVAPNDPTLRNLTNMANVAGRITDAIRAGPVHLSDAPY